MRLLLLEDQALSFCNMQSSPSWELRDTSTLSKLVPMVSVRHRCHSKCLGIQSMTGSSGPLASPRNNRMAKPHQTANSLTLTRVKNRAALTGLYPLDVFTPTTTIGTI